MKNVHVKATGVVREVYIKLNERRERGEIFSNKAYSMADIYEGILCELKTKQNYNTEQLTDWCINQPNVISSLRDK